MLKQCIKKAVRKLMNFKVTDEERALMQAKADKYTNGNVSDWLRYAGTKLDPKKCDLLAD